jgi:hypothetical protein
MNRFYSIGLVATAWLLLGAAPNAAHGQAAEVPTALIYQIANPTEPIVSSLQQVNETKHPNIDCSESGKDRSSELCAQWKAANAATWSVWIALGGLLLGIFTTLAAIGAAIFARRAAISTRDAAKVAQDTLEESRKQHAAQNRAWVGFSTLNPTLALDSTVVDVGRGDFLLVYATFKNTGATPALKCCGYAEHFVEGESDPEFDDIDQKNGGPIFPQTQAHTRPCFIPLELANKVFRGEKKIYICFAMFYNDIFFAERRKTIVYHPISISAELFPSDPPVRTSQVVQLGMGLDGYSECT